MNRQRGNIQPDISRETVECEQRILASGGNTLALLEALEALGLEGLSDSSRHSLALELSRVSAEVGNYSAAHRYADVVYGQQFASTSPITLEQFSRFIPMDACAFLVSAAHRSRVVMINEAHHVPQHRAFALTLLDALRSEGFRYFAAEGLSDLDPELNRRGYPIVQSGTYIAEPVYGDLIRTALRLGYRVISYEGFGDTDREYAQASNLVQRVLADDPGARILVHGGYNHINKSGKIAGRRPMAVQFAEITGITPLAVDQTVMTEHSSSEFEHPLYRMATARGLKEPTIFITGEGRPFTVNPELRDVTVFHPRSETRLGRPTWLLMNGLRRLHQLSKSVCHDRTRCLIVAKNLGESKDSVPADQIVAGPGNSTLALVLPSGSFLVDVEDSAGQKVTSFRIEVPAEP